MYFGGWTDSDAKACRTYGRLGLLLAAVILIPPIVVDIALTITRQTVLGVGVLYGILIDYEDRVPGTWSLGRYRATFLPMLAGLVLASTIWTFSGLTMLGVGERASTDASHLAQAGRRCRFMLLQLALLPIWALLLGVALAAVGVTQLLGYYLGSLIMLYLMEWLFIVPHLLAVIFLWVASLSLGGVRLPRTVATNRAK